MSTNEIQELISAVKSQTKEWLTAEELFKDYGITKSTQSKMRMARTLPYHKVGKYIRYKRSDINTLFNNAKVV